MEHPVSAVGKKWTLLTSAIKKPASGGVAKCRVGSWQSNQCCFGLRFIGGAARWAVGRVTSVVLGFGSLVGLQGAGWAVGRVSSVVLGFGSFSRLLPLDPGSYWRQFSRRKCL